MWKAQAKRGIPSLHQSQKGLSQIEMIEENNLSRLDFIWALVIWPMLISWKEKSHQHVLVIIVIRN